MEVLLQLEAVADPQQVVVGVLLGRLGMSLVQTQSQTPTPRVLILREYPRYFGSDPGDGAHPCHPPAGPRNVGLHGWMI